MAKKPPNSGKRWTPSDDRQLRKEASGNTPTGLVAWHMGRTEDAIRSRASEIGLSLKPTNQSPYGTTKKR